MASAKKRHDFPWLLLCGMVLPVVLVVGGFVINLIPPNIIAVSYDIDISAVPSVDVKNDLLQQALIAGRVTQVHLPPAESFLEDVQGRIYTGLSNGTIVRFHVDSDDQFHFERFTQTGDAGADCGHAHHLRKCGHPQGLSWDKNGNIIVADAGLGLLSISPDGGVTTMINFIEGRPFVFPNSVAVHPDSGLIYLTESSQYFNLHEAVAEMMSGRPTGMFLQYDRVTKKTTVLKDKVAFANGVCITHDKKGVLFASTTRYKIFRYDIETGQVSTFADKLFVGPDNITKRPNGKTYWVSGIPTDATTSIMAKLPWLRWVLAKIPQDFYLSLLPLHGLAVEIDENGIIVIAVLSKKNKKLGQVVSVLQDVSGKVAWVSQVLETSNRFYFGSWYHEYISTFSKDT